MSAHTQYRKALNSLLHLATNEAQYIALEAWFKESVTMIHGVSATNRRMIEKSKNREAMYQHIYESTARGMTKELLATPGLVSRTMERNDEVEQVTMSVLVLGVSE